VLLIAALGFVNYILLKAAGPRGLAVTGFLGGLVNSTVTVTEMAERTRAGGAVWIGPASCAIALATMAMLVRNAVLLGPRAGCARSRTSTVPSRSWSWPRALRPGMPGE
jgi:uncharacterized membrane protein (DUF4010 family)